MGYGESSSLILLIIIAYIETGYASMVGHRTLDMERSVSTDE